jgi:hypothetical protein
MLSVAKEHLLDRAETSGQRADVEKFLTVHGQELSTMSRLFSGRPTETTSRR